MLELNDNDVKANAFVRAMLDHFKATMLKYQAGATTTEERRTRALAIAAAVAKIRFEDSGIIFSLAPIVTEEVIDGVTVKSYACADPNDKCCCGTSCVPMDTPCPACDNVT